MLDLTWIADVAGRPGAVDEAREERRQHRVGRTSPPRRNSSDNHYGIVAVCFPFRGLKRQPYPSAQWFWEAAKAAFCSAVASFWYFARHSSYGIP